MTAACEIITVEHLGRYRLRLGFADGFVGDVDLSARIKAATGPMFEPLRMDLQEALAELLGERVDVVSVGGLKDRDDHILREAVPI